MFSLSVAGFGENVSSVPEFGGSSVRAFHFYVTCCTVTTVEQRGDNNGRDACLRRGVLEREATLRLKASESSVSGFGVDVGFI